MKKIISSALLLALFLTLVIGLFAPVAMGENLIDIGEDNWEGSGGTTQSSTILNKLTAATGSGLVEFVNIKISSSISAGNLKIGTFYNTSGTTFYCRDSWTNGNATGTGNVTFEVNLEVELGDLLGIYVGDGWVYSSNSAGGGYYWKVGEYCDPGDYVSYTNQPVGYAYAYGYTAYPVVTGAPVCEILDAGNVTSTTALLRGHITWDGNSTGNCSAVFTYSGGGQEETVSYGYVTSGETIEYYVPGLIPHNWYVYWMVVSNEYGECWSDDVIHFETLPATEASVPVAETLAATLVTDDSAHLNGRVRYDGELDCVVGFQYRLQGSSTWLNGWNPTDGGLWNTDDYFAADLTALQHNETYEFRAQVKNSLGTAYGSTLTFITVYGVAHTPAPDGGVGFEDLIPSSINHYFQNWSPMVKMILAIILTVGGMAILAVKTPRAKASGLAVGAYGGLATIGFLIAGWYPQWVLILLGAIVGVLLLLILLGGRK